jgi:hypothetical protein
MKTEKTNNYLQFLLELKRTLELTPYVSLTKLAKKHDVSARSSLVLQEGKIITNKGTKGRGAHWEWTSPINPNTAMAQETYNRILDKWKDENKITRQEPVKEEAPVKRTRKPRVKKEVVETRTETKISILWGLIKIVKG